MSNTLSDERIKAAASHIYNLGRDGKGFTDADAIAFFHDLLAANTQAAPAPQQPVAERFALYWIGDSNPRYVDGKNMKLCLSAEESMENVFPSQKSQYEVHRMLVYPSDAVGEQATPSLQQLKGQTK